MTVTRSEARDVRYWLDRGTPAQGAHQCSVQLQALGSYTCGHTARVRHLLRTLQNIEQHETDGLLPAGTGQRWRTKVNQVANEDSASHDYQVHADA